MYVHRAGHAIDYFDKLHNDALYYAIVLGYLFCLCHCLYINILMMCNTFDWNYFFPDTSV